MPTKAHPRRADPAIARLEAHEAVDTESGVFVVGGEFLLDLPGIAAIGSRSIICESLRTSELVVAGWCRDDIAVSGNLAGEAFDRSSYYGVSIARCSRGALRAVAMASDSRRRGYCHAGLP